MELLKKLCEIHSPSGEEYRMKEFLIEYVNQNCSNWKVKPEIISDEKTLQDNLILKFGKPVTAAFCHIDTVGYTVRYGKELIKIGSPFAENKTTLTGEDSKGKIECFINDNGEDNDFEYFYTREIDRGTSLVFKSDFYNDGEYITSPYLDNRAGIYTALKLAETMQDGILAFTTFEEHRGGGAEIAAKYLFEKEKIRQALILDSTWVTEGVNHGDGAVISLRDSGIPRKRFLDKIIKIAKENIQHFTFEVESSGGSDGTAIQRTPYPIDWCFIGIAESGVHSPVETMKITDIEDTLRLYKILMNKL